MFLITTEENMEIVYTKATKIIIRPDGIIESHPKEDWNEPDSVETARETALKLQEIANSGTYAHISFPPNLYIKKEIVQAYLEVDINHIAEAVVVKSFGARLLGKLALQIKKPTTPSKMFGTKEEAEVWLLEQLEKAKAAL